MNSGNDNVVLDAPTVLAESTARCIDSTKNKTLQYFALFLLKLESHCFVPKRTLLCIVDEISCLDKIRRDKIC